MIIKANTPEGLKAVLYDVMGKKVPCLTETQEAEICPQAENAIPGAPRFVVADGEVVKVKVKL